MFFKQEEKWGIILFLNSLPNNPEYYYLLNILCDHAQDISGGIEEISNPISDFYLGQNFPNPFNPSTTISWQLAEGSDATLKVYDILGREIGTLVNEYRPAGKYETEFNAASLPSGVYFYQLKAVDPSTGSQNGQAGQSFIQTRKMVLLK